MPNLIGLKLGKYQIVERVARGGMADVYRGRAVSLDRDVAVKVMHDHLTHSQEYATRFKREADSIARLRHPHIVQLYDFDVEGETHYMVMEFVKGGTVEQLLRSKGQLDAAQALDIAIPLADALGYAHDSGIIHRDIKPSNIMFADTQFEHPILTDFGITMVQNSLAITREGLIIGTPGYISPEAGLHQKLDKGADIYSMGVLLYELVTGRLPFKDENPFVMFLSQMNDPLPDPRQFAPNIPPKLVEVIHRCLAPSPQDRYQTAYELKDALEQVRSEAVQPTATAEQVVSKIPPKGMPTIVLDDDANSVVSLDLVSNQHGLVGTGNRSAKIVGVTIAAAALIGLLWLAGGNFAQIGKQPTTTQPATMVSAAVSEAFTATVLPTATSVLPTATIRATVNVQPTPQSVSPTSVAFIPPTVLPSATFTVQPTEQPASPTPVIIASTVPTVVPTSAPLSLDIGKEITGRLTVGETAHTYSFTPPTNNAVFLILRNQDMASGLLLELEDQDTGELIASLRPRVMASCIRINPNAHTYLVSIGSEEASFERSYSLQIAEVTPQQRDCPVR